MNCCGFRYEFLVLIVKKLYLHPSCFESNCLLHVAINANYIAGANVTAYLLSLKVGSRKFNTPAGSIFLKYLTKPPIPDLSS